jgi:hypothetical protein
MFRTDLLSIIRSLHTAFTAMGIFHAVVLTVCAVFTAIGICHASYAAWLLAKVNALNFIVHNISSKSSH